MNPKFTLLLVCVCYMRALILADGVYINTTLYIAPNTPNKLLDNVYLDDNASIINKTKISLNGDLLKFGTSDSAFVENVEFTGNFDQRIEGEKIKIDSISINKSNGNLNILNDLVIKKAINFKKGKINNTLRTIHLSENATLAGENDSNRIVGLLSRILIQKNINAPNNENAGNLGAIITTSQNLGNTQIERIVNSFSFLGISSAERFYNITTGNNTNLNAQLILKYLTTELNGNNENTLAMYTSLDNGITWSMTSTNVDLVNKTVTANNLNNLRSHTFAEISGTPLPVELLSFNAKFNTEYNHVDINWVTSSEINNNYFSVEKSEDGINFVEINKIFSKGNSSTNQYYDDIDQNVKENMIYYYRLKQVDFDGNQTNSDIQKVEILNQNNISKNINIYPTLITNNKFNISNAKMNELNIFILDLQGRILYNTKTNEKEFTINTSNLSNNTYIVQCQNLDEKNIITKKIYNIK